MEQERKAIAKHKKACVQCGAELRYKPGSKTITCQYCNHTEEIVSNWNAFEELELKPYLVKMGSLSHSEEILMLNCKSCGANQHIEENYKSLHCVYCATPLIVADSYTENWIVPGAILPFQFDQNKAHQIFTTWVKGLWFAPNKLKKAAINPEYTKGLYLPYWTFDAQLAAGYKGKRGTYYTVNIPYTTTENGKTVRRIRTERHIEWSPVKGTIKGFIDDTLIKASKPQRHPIPSKITNWNLKALVPYSASFLAGFITEKYTIPLKEGHLDAQKEAKVIASSWIARDIGGDEQQIHSIDMRLDKETFKHILLPVYISSYSFSGKQYHFFVNGQSGSIHGKRPYSFWKICFFSIFLLSLALLYFAFFN